MNILIKNINNKNYIYKETTLESILSDVFTLTINTLMLAFNYYIFGNQWWSNIFCFIVFISFILKSTLNKRINKEELNEILKTMDIENENRC